jgi:L-fuculose-phosphate aldolase
MEKQERTMRRQIIFACRRLDQLGYVPATDGNVSVRIGSNEILITPSLTAKGSLRPGQLLVVHLDGRTTRGRGTPSSELLMHLAVYRRRPDVNAVVHAHPPAATAFAVARKTLPTAILPEAILTLGPVPLARYARPGTAAVARSIDRLIARHDDLLLANHGALCLGTDLDEALHRMERIEYLAQVTIAALQIGGARRLSISERRRIAAIRKAVQSQGRG